MDKSSFCGATRRRQQAESMERTREHSARGKSKTQQKGGAKKPELAKVLCENSGVDVEWLMDKFNIDLSLVARLGGPLSSPNPPWKGAFPRHDFICASIQMVKKIAE